LYNLNENSLLIQKGIALNSLLLALKEGKGMGSVTVIPKVKYIWLWNKEKNTHTYTRSPQDMPSLDVLQPQHQSPGKDWTAGERWLRSH
jgi:hypothetical protein